MIIKKKLLIFSSFLISLLLLFCINLVNLNPAFAEDYDSMTTDTTTTDVTTDVTSTQSDLGSFLDSVMASATIDDLSIAAQNFMESLSIGDASVGDISDLGTTVSTGTQGGEDTSIGGFPELIESILSDAQLSGQEAGTNPGGAMGLGDLSNLNNTIDNSGITASYEIDDPNPGIANWPGPVLSANVSCVSYKPIVHLTWTGTPIPGHAGPGGTRWVVLRSGMTPSYFLPLNQVGEMFKDDASVSKRTIYYYQVYSFDAGGSNSRSRLSNLMAVYTPECPLSGYVYNDLNRNGVCDLNTNGGCREPGVPGETVQIIRGFYTTSGECVTTTDSEGQPTGQDCAPDIPHPAAVVWSGQTNTSGYYTISGITPEAGRTYTVKHARDPLLPGWLRVNPAIAEVALPFGINPTVSYGLYSPVIPSPTPTPIPNAPVVTLIIKSPDREDRVSGGLPAEVNQNETANLIWQTSNVDTNSCAASVTSGTDRPVPQPVINIWKDGKADNGGPISIPTSEPNSKYIFNLVCKQNNANLQPVSIQLNIKQFPPAYFQTTGGDVHSNDTIYITPATP
jgi:hypothetical protein